MISEVIPAVLAVKHQRSEKDVIRALIIECRSRGYNLKRYRQLKYGAIDLLAWNDKQIVVFEVKYSDPEAHYEGSFHDVLEGLGQLLSYREQFHVSGKRLVKYVLYLTAEMGWNRYYFLRQLCANHGIILHAPLVDLVRYL